MHRQQLGTTIVALSVILCGAATAWGGHQKGYQKDKDVAQKGCDHCGCDGRHRGDHQRHHFHEPPNAPILASTPAVLAPLVYSPVAGRRDTGSSLEELLRLLRDGRDEDDADAAARTPRDKAESGSAPRAETTSEERLLQSLRPPALESEETRIHRLEQAVKDLDRRLDTLGVQLKETLDRVIEINERGR